MVSVNGKKTPPQFQPKVSRPYFEHKIQKENEWCEKFKYVFNKAYILNIDIYWF